jgi:hypothetical protein
MEREGASMALDEYGVAIGNYVRFTRDNPDNFGHYFHGHITIGVPGGQIESAIDVNKPNGGVQYFHPTKLDAAKFNPVSGMADGYHQLARNASSGALDYKRNPLISEPLGCGALFFVFLNWITGGHQDVWTDNVGTTALDHLESMFASPGTVSKVYLFGAPYPVPHAGSPQGMHDVHCNQGDPVGSFQHLDAIWQDGGVIVKYTDAHLEGFFVKFETQTLNTNDQGLPA